jgi:hypothetical protein
MSIKNLYSVKSIDSYECYDWLLNKHYAKRIPSISYSFGLFKENILNGVMTIGKPASNSLCEGICGYENSKYVYELNRLVINEGLDKNVLSFFVSNAIKLIKENLIIVSYADTEWGHNGYIYQATNWIYTGCTKERTDIGLEDGSHSRHYDKNLDYTKNRKKRSSKHRYVFFIGDLKSQFRSHLRYKIESYPKGDNKRYDASYIPKPQLNLF